MPVFYDKHAMFTSRKVLKASTSEQTWGQD